MIHSFRPNKDTLLFNIKNITEIANSKLDEIQNNIDKINENLNNNNQDN